MGTLGKKWAILHLYILNYVPNPDPERVCAGAIAPPEGWLVRPRDPAGAAPALCDRVPTPGDGPGDRLTARSIRCRIANPGDPDTPHFFAIGRINQIVVTGDDLSGALIYPAENFRSGG